MGQVKKEVENWLKKNKPKVFKPGETNAKFQFNPVRRKKKK